MKGLDFIVQVVYNEIPDFADVLKVSKLLSRMLSVSTEGLEDGLEEMACFAPEFSAQCS